MATKVFKQGTTDSLVLRNDNPKRFLFNVHADPNKSYPIDLSQIDVKMTLMRDGNQETLCSGILSVLHMISTYFSGQFEFYLSAQYKIDDGNYTTIPAVVDLGGILNLDGDDQLEIEVKVDKTAFGDIADSNYVTLSVEPGIGIERYTPFIQYKVIPVATSTEDYHLGDNVGRICLLTTFAAPTDNIPNTNPTQKYVGYGIDENKNYKYCKSATISSLYYNRVMPIEELQDYKHTFFESQVPVYLRAYNYILFEPLEGIDLDSVRVNLSLDENKITQGKYFLAWRSYKVTSSLMAKADKMLAKQNEVFQIKLDNATKPR